MPNHIERERQDIFASLAQRGNEERHNVEAVEQVFSEASLCYSLLQVGIGGGDQTDIHFNRAGATQSHEASFLKYAQKFGLHAGRHVGDLIQENGSVVRLFQ